VARAAAEPGERLEDAADRSQSPDLVRPARPAKDDDTASADDATMSVDAAQQMA